MERWRFRDQSSQSGRRGEAQKPLKLAGWLPHDTSALEEGLPCGSSEDKLHESRDFCHYIQP